MECSLFVFSFNGKTVRAAPLQRKILCRLVNRLSSWSCEAQILTGYHFLIAFQASSWLSNSWWTKISCRHRPMSVCVQCLHSPSPLSVKFLISIKHFWHLFGRVKAIYFIGNFNIDEGNFWKENDFFYTFSFNAWFILSL